MPEQHPLVNGVNTIKQLSTVVARYNPANADISTDKTDDTVAIFCL